VSPIRFWETFYFQVARSRRRAKSRAASRHRSSQSTARPPHRPRTASIPAPQSHKTREEIEEDHEYVRRVLAYLDEPSEPGPSSSKGKVFGAKPATSQSSRSGKAVRSPKHKTSKSPLTVVDKTQTMSPKKNKKQAGSSDSPKPKQNDENAKETNVKASPMVKQKNETSKEINVKASPKTKQNVETAKETNIKASPKARETFENAAETNVKVNVKKDILGDLCALMLSNGAKVKDSVIKDTVVKQNSTPKPTSNKENTPSLKSDQNKVPPQPDTITEQPEASKSSEPSREDIEAERKARKEAKKAAKSDPKLAKQMAAVAKETKSKPGPSDVAAVGEKSKADLKKERREKQEAQRAAKEAEKAEAKKKEAGSVSVAKDDESSKVEDDEEEEGVHDFGGFKAIHAGYVADVDNTDVWPEFEKMAVAIQYGSLEDHGDQVIVLIEAIITVLNEHYVEPNSDVIKSIQDAIEPCYDFLVHSQLLTNNIEVVFIYFRNELLNMINRRKVMKAMAKFALARKLMKDLGKKEELSVEKGEEEEDDLDDYMYQDYDLTKMYENEDEAVEKKDQAKLDKAFYERRENLKGIQEYEAKISKHAVWQATKNQMHNSLRRFLVWFLRAMYRRGETQHLVPMLADRLRDGAVVMLYKGEDIAARCLEAALAQGRRLTIYVADGEEAVCERLMRAGLNGGRLVRCRLQDCASVLLRCYERGESVAFACVPVTTVLEGGRSLGPAGHSLVCAGAAAAKVPVISLPHVHQLQPSVCRALKVKPWRMDDEAALAYDTLRVNKIAPAGSQLLGRRARCARPSAGLRWGLREDGAEDEGGATPPAPPPPSAPPAYRVDQGVPLAAAQLSDNCDSTWPTEAKKRHRLCAPETRAYKVGGTFACEAVGRGGPPSDRMGAAALRYDRAEGAEAVQGYRERPDRIGM